MRLANLSERLYSISEQMGGGFNAECVESCAKQASSLELDIENFSKEVEAFASMEEWTVDTLPEFMQRMNLYVQKFSRNVHLAGVSDSAESDDA